MRGFQITSLVLAIALAAQQGRGADPVESDFYRLTTFEIPAGAVVEAARST